MSAPTKMYETKPEKVPFVTTEFGTEEPDYVRFCRIASKFAEQVKIPILLHYRRNGRKMHCAQLKPQLTLTASHET